jgi:hypothetical protein
MTLGDLGPLYDARTHLELARSEAAREQSRLEGDYRQLRRDGAEIQDLISARMLFALAQVHLVNVTSEWMGVRDKIDACRRATDGSLAAGAVL